MASTPAPSDAPASAPPATAAPPPKAETCQNDYDWIVVGAGPAGLTLATYLPGRVLLLERDATIGGIHKVRRDVGGMFSEHGPRVYAGCFVNFRRVLADIGLEWHEVFTPAEYSPALIDGKSWYQWLSPREVMVLVYHFFRMVLDGDYGKDLTLLELCRSNGFSERSAQYIDTVCRFTDGAGIDRFSVHQFLHGFSDHFGYGFYEPKKANDTLMFPQWQRFLDQRGVTTKLATTVREITHSCGRATGVVALTGGQPTTYTARRIIMAVPPTPLHAVLRASGLKEPGLWALREATEYDSYFPVAYHFPKGSPRLVTHVGARTTPWGLIYIEMSRYMRDEPTAFVMVSASRLDVKSPVTGKTANESTRQECIQEMLRQLPIADSLKATLVRAVPSSCLKREKGKWVNIDEAYIHNAGYPLAVPFKLKSCRGAYSVGVQNERSWYAYTSVEAAVCGALSFLGETPREPATPLRALRVLLVFLLVAVSLRLALPKAWLRRL